MLIKHRGARPDVHESTYVAPTAVVSGDVVVGPDCSILFGAVVTSEGGPVELGQGCVIMEHAVVRGTPKNPTQLGARVLVGPHAHLTGCSVEDDAFLATGSTVFNGAKVGRGAEVRINAVIHVNATLPPETVVPIGWVAVGTPARVLPPQEHDAIWQVQRESDFPGTVFGVSRDRPQGETTRRYAAAMRDSHAGDVIVERLGSE